MGTIADYRKELIEKTAQLSDIIMLNKFLDNLDAGLMSDFNLYHWLEREPTESEQLVFLMHWQRVKVNQLVKMAYRMKDELVKDFILKSAGKGIPLDIFIGSMIPSLLDQLFREKLLKGVD